MTESLSPDFFREQGLLPYQADFAVAFLDPASERHWEWVVPVGAGKSFAAAAIAAQISKPGAEVRILVLAPRALVEQWSYALRRHDLAAAPMVVDRRTFLELEANVDVDEEPWPTHATIVMSIDLAKRADMALAITRSRWDLVVIDESHSLRGQRKGLFDSLITRPGGGRTLLLTATPVVQAAGVTRRVVGLREIVDWEGNHLIREAEKEVKELVYRRTEEEAKLLDRLQRLASNLVEHFPHGKLQSSSVLRAASSSPLALEAVLQRLNDGWRPLRNKLAHQLSPTEDDFQEVLERLDTLTELDELESPSAARVLVEPGVILSLVNDVDGLLEWIGEQESDTKLAALQNHLHDTLSQKRHRNVCVWTSYLSTARYLESSLSGGDHQVFRFTGDMSVEERSRQLGGFRDAGGVLVLTDAAAEGTDLGFVTQCVNYDLPLDPVAFEIRWGRFLRLGRKEPFEMLVLRDDTESLDWETVLLRMIRKGGEIGQTQAGADPIED